MPYIKSDDRPMIRVGVQLLAPSIKTPGELNYAISTLVSHYLDIQSKVRSDNPLAKPNYALYNEAIGVLECAKLELYRHTISQYEEVKIKENGDI